MKFLEYDFRWIDENACEMQASLDGKLGRKMVKIGDALSLEVCSDVRCAGSMKEGKFTPCPKNETGKSKCEYCRACEGNFVFTAFDGFDQSNLAPEDLGKIAGPHVVYLALFDRDLVKIGVAKKERKVLRQLEQGSHQTLFVAETPDGIAARQIETSLRRSGIMDKVQAAQKKGFLLPEISEEEGEKNLREIFEKHKGALEQIPHLKNFVFPNPEFKSWESFYGTTNLRQNRKTFHPLKLEKEDWVSGEIRAIKGSFLVIETPDELVAISAKDLNGREIDFGQKPSGLKTGSTLQRTLF